MLRVIKFEIWTGCEKTYKEVSSPLLVQGAIRLEWSRLPIGILHQARVARKDRLLERLIVIASFLALCGGHLGYTYTLLYCLPHICRYHRHIVGTVVCTRQQFPKNGKCEEATRNRCFKTTENQPIRIDNRTSIHLRPTILSRLTNWFRSFFLASGTVLHPITIATTFCLCSSVKKNPCLHIIFFSCFPISLLCDTDYSVSLRATMNRKNNIDTCWRKLDM